MNKGLRCKGKAWEILYCIWYKWYEYGNLGSKATLLKPPPCVRTARISHLHKNGIVTLAPLLLHERGTHSSSCPVVKRISNAFSKIQNMFHELNHL